MNHRSFTFFTAAVAWVSVFAWPADGAVSNTPAILEHNVAWVRVSRVEKDLAKEAAPPAATNKIIGTVLDLRFADGDDFAAAQAAADAFEAEKLPLAILVNGRTRDAAVALASELRAARAGLVFGSATAPVSTNGETIPSLKPDLVVTAAVANERAWMKNPYAVRGRNNTNSLASTNTLLPFVDHTSEADLMREQHQSGGAEDFPQPAPAATPPPPVIHDPVLARAVDLIKGLAVIDSAKR